MSSFNDGQVAHYALDKNVIVRLGGMHLSDQIALTIAAAGTRSVAFTIGSKAVLLARFGITTDSANTSVELFEGGAFSAGSAKTTVNVDRTSNRTDSPVSAFSDGATIDTPGTHLASGQVYGGGSGANTQIVSGSGGGFILKPLTTYYITIVNNDGSLKNYEWEIALGILD